MARSRPNTAIIKDPRELAVRLLMEVAEHKLLVPQASLRLPFKMKPADRQLCYEMVYGTLRYLPGLEQVLLQFCPKPRFPDAIRWLLLMSLYQIGFMRIPDYATVNEALEVVRRLKMDGLSGLVNGVLRNVVRKGPSLWSETPGETWLLPDWMRGRFRKQYGETRLHEWLVAWRHRPEQSYWSPSDQGLEDDPQVRGFPHAFRHKGPLQAEDLLNQKIYVQNESSQAIAELACRLKPKKVLDLCAAPGGKACYLAAFGNLDRLLAGDISGERLDMMIQNMQRLDLNFETLLMDGTCWSSDERFDLVMVDAPCSGIGIIGRHPEIKMHKSAPAPQRLLDLQSQLMAHGFHFVRPGGYLLFSVCSLDRSEIPLPPPDAIYAEAKLCAKMLEGVAKFEKDRFYLSPSTSRDGFQGVLLRKPER